MIMIYSQYLIKKFSSDSSFSLESSNLPCINKNSNSLLGQENFFLSTLSPLIFGYKAIIRHKTYPFFYLAKIFINSTIKTIFDSN